MEWNIGKEKWRWCLSEWTGRTVEHRWCDEKGRLHKPRDCILAHLPLREFQEMQHSFLVSTVVRGHYNRYYFGSNLTTVFSPDECIGDKWVVDINLYSFFTPETTVIDLKKIRLLKISSWSSQSQASFLNKVNCIPTIKIFLQMVLILIYCF